MVDEGDPCLPSACERQQHHSGQQHNSNHSGLLSSRPDHILWRNGWQQSTSIVRKKLLCSNIWLVYTFIEVWRKPGICPISAPWQNKVLHFDWWLPGVWGKRSLLWCGRNFDIVQINTRVTTPRPMARDLRDLRNASLSVSIRVTARTALLVEKKNKTRRISKRTRAGHDVKRFLYSCSHNTRYQIITIHWCVYLYLSGWYAQWQTQLKHENLSSKTTN